MRIKVPCHILQNITDHDVKGMNRVSKVLGMVKDGLSHLKDKNSVDRAQRACERGMCGFFKEWKERHCG